MDGTGVQNISGKTSRKMSISKTEKEMEEQYSDGFLEIVLYVVRICGGWHWLGDCVR